MNSAMAGSKWAAPRETTCQRCGTKIVYQNRNPAKWCKPCRNAVKVAQARAQREVA